MSEGNNKAAFVLHIEDDANDTELFRAAVRRAHLPLPVRYAADGDEAMRMLNSLDHVSGEEAQGKPSLILMDLKMPRNTGIEILEWIRSKPAISDVPVVVLSGSQSQADIQKAYDAGANSYLIKPLGFESLVRMVSRISSVWCCGTGESPKIANSGV